MIDFEQIGRYWENNRIEAKKALGGLPHSIWETYSSFANTFGGIVLLGVVELADKTFQTVNLPQPERLIEEFKHILNDKERVSANILSDKDIGIHEIDGNRILAITVPRADRRVRPVYLGTDPYRGSYRRDGEGDYHCTEEEVRMMLRDREERTQDMRILTGLGKEVFDYETVRRYRTYWQDCQRNQLWEKASDEEVLLHVGACGRGEDGNVHPSAAGLLMFGFEDEIVKEFPSFFLDYQERGEDGSVQERIVSNAGRFSGNLFDFYLRVSGKIVRGLPADVHRQVREAAANCMMNGDYFGSSGLVIVKRRDAVSITNPGSFRIDIEDAVNGGKSDPRNVLVARLFNLVRIGTHAGKGVPDMYAVWEKKGWEPPRIKERFRPERITLTLPLKAGSQKTKRGECRPGKQEDREKLIDYVTRQIQITADTAGNLLRMPVPAAEKLLEEMEREGILSVIQKEERLFQLKI